MEADCREMIEKMQEYLDGECDEDVCRLVEEHLRTCEHCRDCLESIRRTIEIVRETQREDMPADVRASLRSALKDCME